MAVVRHPASSMVSTRVEPLQWIYVRAAPSRLGQHGDAQKDRSRSAPYAHVTASRQPFRAGYVASASADGGAGSSIMQSVNVSDQQKE